MHIVTHVTTKAIKETTELPQEKVVIIDSKESMVDLEDEEVKETLKQLNKE